VMFRILGVLCIVLWVSWKKFGRYVGLDLLIRVVVCLVGRV